MYQKKLLVTEELLLENKKRLNSVAVTRVLSNGHHQLFEGNPLDFGKNLSRIRDHSCVADLTPMRNRCKIRRIRFEQKSVEWNVACRFTYVCRTFECKDSGEPNVNAGGKFQNFIDEVGAGRATVHVQSRAL